jgi:hypothetical protein
MLGVGNCTVLSVCKYYIQIHTLYLTFLTNYSVFLQHKCSLGQGAGLHTVGAGAVTAVQLGLFNCSRVTSSEGIFRCDQPNIKLRRTYQDPYSANR